MEMSTVNEDAQRAPNDVGPALSLVEMAAITSIEASECALLSAEMLTRRWLLVVDLI